MSLLSLTIFTERGFWKFTNYPQANWVEKIFILNYTPKFFDRNTYPWSGGVLDPWIFDQIIHINFLTIKYSNVRWYVYIIQIATNVIYVKVIEAKICTTFKTRVICKYVSAHGYSI